MSFTILLTWLDAIDLHSEKLTLMWWGLFVWTPPFIVQVYDVGTGQIVRTYYDANIANHYQQNRATFDPTDELLLNDGVLWDVNGGKPIHKFDKLSPQLSGGVFNPNGLEVIINCQVVSSLYFLYTKWNMTMCVKLFQLPYWDFKVLICLFCSLQWGVPYTKNLLVLFTVGHQDVSPAAYSACSWSVQLTLQL